MRLPASIALSVGTKPTAPTVAETTVSASGCVAAWMVRNGAAKSGQIIHIEQGVEIKRPSQIFVRAEKQGDRIDNVRVGGHAVEVMEGLYSV